MINKCNNPNPLSFMQYNYKTKLTMQIILNKNIFTIAKAIAENEL